MLAPYRGRGCRKGKDNREFWKTKVAPRNQERYMLYERGVDEAELRTSTGDLNVVNVQKVDVGVDENRSKQHCKEDQENLCQCSF